MMAIHIRPARPEDAKFMAWLILTAGRAHVTRGIWEVILGGTEQENLKFLSLLAVTTVPHLFHYSCYLVAESDGRPVAGLGGYDPNRFGYAALQQAMPQVFKQLGQLGPDPQAQKRAERVLCCIPDNAQDAWIIDSVATQKGFRRAQINLYIGNQPAQRAYEKHGFKIMDEKCHPDFEAEIGSPGMVRMLKNL